MTTENKELQKLQSLLTKQYKRMEKLGWKAEMIEDTTEFLNNQFFLNTLLAYLSYRCLKNLSFFLI